MLKNVHLAPQWLVQLEKKLHSLQPHAGFRLFLTMEINPKLPVNLLRAGRIFVFEPPPGIRANLLRTFSTVSRFLPFAVFVIIMLFTFCRQIGTCKQNDESTEREGTSVLPPSLVPCDSSGAFAICTVGLG